MRMIEQCARRSRRFSYQLHHEIHRRSHVDEIIVSYVSNYSRQSSTQAEITIIRHRLLQGEVTVDVNLVASRGQASHQLFAHDEVAARMEWKQAKDPKAIRGLQSQGYENYRMQ